MPRALARGVVAGLANHEFDFVIELPSNDGRMIFEGAAQRQDIAANRLPIQWMIQASGLPAHRMHADAGLTLDQDLRVAFHKPLRREVTRSAQDGFHSPAIYIVQVIFQPAEVVAAGRRLKVAPGRLAHPHYFEVRLLEDVEHAVPLVARLQFGVGAGAE